MLLHKNKKLKAVHESCRSYKLALEYYEEKTKLTSRREYITSNTTLLEVWVIYKERFEPKRVQTTSQAMQIENISARICKKLNSLTFTVPSYNLNTPLALFKHLPARPCFEHFCPSNKRCCGDSIQFRERFWSWTNMRRK